MTKKILVLGGGLGGVEAAIDLKKKFKNDYQVDLISNRDFLYIYPASIWLTIGKRTVEDLSIPLPQLAEIHGFNFLHEEVKEISGQQQRVVTDQEEHQYDYLIVALGATKVKPKGVENTYSVCSGPEEGIRIQEKFLELVERGHGTIACGFSGNPKDSTAVRGGPMFEVAFNMDHYLREKGLRDNFKLIFFSPSPTPGKRLGQKGLTKLGGLFKERNIETRTGKKFKEFTENSIIFEDNSYVEADLIAYIPGLSGNPVLTNSDLPLTDAGFVPVNNGGLAQGFDNCYVIGDSSFFEGPTWRAKQGHLAEVMARTTAENIALQEAGKEPTASFHEEINLLCVMDLGDDGVFVYRDEDKGYAPKGMWAHWAKLAWERYYKWNKYGKIPRLM
ncbi:MAG: NAD(P)/FAD-dependent oxidoreductase [Cyanobacteriota bacterium]